MSINLNLKEWVNDVNTTNYRILDSVWLANFVVVLLTISVTFFHWEPSAMQLKIFTGIGAGILTMMGFDVLQFWGKRFSDAGYAAAKNPNQPVVTNVVAEQSGDTKSAPSSLSRTLEHPVPINPELATALQIGADRDARLAAGTLPVREE